MDNSEAAKPKVTKKKIYGNQFFILIKLFVLFKNFYFMNESRPANKKILNFFFIVIKLFILKILFQGLIYKLKNVFIY